MLCLCCLRGSAFKSLRLWKDVFLCVVISIIFSPLFYYFSEPEEEEDELAQVGAYHWLVARVDGAGSGHIEMI